MFRLTKNPHTKKWEKAKWRLNHNDEYVVEFPNGKVYYDKDWKLEVRDG